MKLLSALLVACVLLLAKSAEAVVVGSLTCPKGICTASVWQSDGQQLVLTARHCLGIEPNETVIDQVGVSCTLTVGAHTERVTLHPHVTADVATGIGHVPVEVPPLSLVPTTPQAGAWILMVSSLTHILPNDAHGAVYQTGVISPLRCQTYPQFMWASVPCWPGASGSPIFYRGRLVGVLTASIKEISLCGIQPLTNLGGLL